ncbi:hypothetical protein DF182_11495 [Chitinophaga flava]|uniref:Uncharacterized protein n=1 Tax=Chitinophaga flava TaxID=2259036 RepID=A0A365Y5A0_9BACT|nr:hypothetical protein DF182_11495 [Chitinophaga flava]
MVVCCNDSIRWRNIARAADSILNPKTPAWKYPSFDNPEYILAFNSKVRSNNSNADNELFSGFLIYLKYTFLYECMKKKPEWGQRKNI